MLDTVREKLREIYDKLTEKQNTILQLFIDQFGEENVDSDILTFDDLVEWLNTKILASFITEGENRNEYGQCNIDSESYANNKHKPILEGISDLGVLDYITPKIIDYLGLRPNDIKYITVHFPRVRITNEFDKYIDVQDIYARVAIRNNGTLLERFKLSRTTYPYKHFMVGYAHSHMSRIDSESAGTFTRPCTGDGPIVNTMRNLSDRYDEQLWGLFTFELSKYVTIESVDGGPYIRLEEVDKGNLDESMSNLNAQPFIFGDSDGILFKDFVKYCAARDIFKFKFIKGQYQIGESTTAIIIKLSNEFLKFLNEYRQRVAYIPSLSTLLNKGVLKKCVVSNGRIYRVNDDRRDISSALRVNGKALFKFKGEWVKLKILVDVDADSHENNSLLLSKGYCERIITEILNIINYRYGKKQKNWISIQANTNSSTGIEEKCYIV